MLFRSGGGKTGATGVNAAGADAAPTAQAPRPQAAPEMATAGAAPAALASSTAPARANFDESDPKTWGSPSRNEPCPCGSGEKFKHCHGKL